MKNLRKLFYNVQIISALLVIIIHVGFNASAQTTIYIDPSYSGSTQNGTQQFPFSSWNSVTWNNGNTYLQKSGTTFNTSGSLIITSKNNITLGSYGTGAKPKIVSSGASTSKVIDVTSCYNMTISNLEVASTTGQVTAAIIIDGTGSGNNLIDNCILRDVQWGIRILTTSAGNRILNCEVYNTQDDGIYIKDTPDIEIGYCNIHHVNLKYFVNPDQSYSAGDNIQIASTNNHQFNIHHNILDHSTTGNKFCFIAWGNNYSGILEHNTMIGNANQTTSCIYLSPTTSSVTVRYNKIRNGNYGIYAYVTNFNVYYNDFVQNKTAISVLNNYHMLAENNVFYNNINNCISALSGSSVISKNNIFHLGSTGKAYSTNGNLISNFNTFNIQRAGFINGYGSLSSWQSASGQDLNSMVANPMFVNPANFDFTLQQGSPCINTGVTCGYSQDFFGNQVPQGSSSDIGYFEFSTTAGNQYPIISNQTFSIQENSINGTIVGQVIASDPDPGQTISYSITSGNSGTVFTINSSNGIITVANGQNLNHEEDAQYLLQITVTDNLGLSSSSIITINVTDVNENPEINDQGFNVNENSLPNTIIGSIIATDPDVGQQLTYSIVGGNTGNTFIIDESSGVLSVLNGELLDFEQNMIFDIIVRVQDNGEGSLYDESLITVTVINVNEQPIVSDQEFYINSTIQNGYIIGQIIAFDPDQNQALNYLIVDGNIYNIFSLDYSTGLLSVINNELLYLAPNPSTLTVNVSDNGNPQLTSTCQIEIFINQVNNPPQIDDQSFITDENPATGSIIGIVIATDPDSGQSLSYNILSGNTNDAFSIDANGQLIVVNASAVNFELINSFNLQVAVSDNGNPSLSTQSEIIVMVNDVNEAPVIVPDQLYTVPANSPEGTFIGTVLYNDEDFGQSASFSIIDGNINNTFSINPSTGDLTVANAYSLKRLGNRVIDLTILVSDSGIPTLSSTGIVMIKIIKKKNFESYSSNNLTEGGIRVFPNPSPDGKFNIIRNHKDENTTSVFQITDMSGTIIKNISNDLSHKYEIDLSSFPKGVYLLRITTSDQIEYKKLIIQ